VITLPPSARPATAPPPTIVRANPALAAAKATARAKTSRIKARASSLPFRYWMDVETYGNVTIPPHIKEQPCTYLNLLNFCEWYEQSAEARLNAAEALVNSTPERQPTKAELLDVILKHFKLRPRQKKAVTAAINVMYKTRQYNAVLVPMPTGSGKSIICSAIIKWLQDNNYNGADRHDMFDVVYIVPKAVEIKTMRTLVKAGVRGVGTEVQVLAYSGLRAKSIAAYFEEVEDTLFDNKVKGYKWRIWPPKLVILDECQRIKKVNTKATRYIHAWLRGGTKTQWLFTSATPGVTLNDLMTFILAARPTYGGELVNRENFNTFARAVGHCAPTAANGAAMERLKDFFGDAIINPPADPSKVKAYNGIMLVDFPSESAKTYYESAQETWLEQCQNLGRVPAERGQVLVAFTNFRRAEEYIKGPVFADLMIQAHRDGYAPVVGVCFIDTVKKIVECLAKAGIPRSKISIIQGGEKEIKEEETFPVRDFIKVHERVCNNEGDDSFLSREDRTRYRKTKKFVSSRWKNHETPEEQRERERWLSNMNLRQQSPAQRQDENDNFQEGRTEYCIFTLPAGGTGIDLDQQVEGVRPRKMFSTICYYAEEFVQGFGRCKREFTLSDVHQFAVFFRNTIVANHVAPRLAKKLGSINKLSMTGVDLEQDLLDAVLKGKVELPVELPPPPVESDETVDDSVLEDDDDDDDKD